MQQQIGVGIATSPRQPSETPYSAFYAVHRDGWHICPRCSVQVVPQGQPFCQPCVSELRRVVRVTARGGDAYENESESDGEG